MNDMRDFYMTRLQENGSVLLPPRCNLAEVVSMLNDLGIGVENVQAEVVYGTNIKLTVKT